VFLCLGTSAFCRQAAMVTGVMETVHTEVSDCYQALKFPCPDTMADLIYPSTGFWLEVQKLLCETELLR
jgi:hypothetical protein